jgi:hypothetical protein
LRVLSAHREKDLRRQELVTRHNNLVERFSEFVRSWNTAHDDGQKKAIATQIREGERTEERVSAKAKQLYAFCNPNDKWDDTRASLVAATANPGAYTVHSSARSRISLTNVARNLVFAEDGAAARDRRLARVTELRAQQEEDNAETAAASQDFAAWVEGDQHEAGMGVGEAAAEVAKVGAEVAEVGAEAAINVRQEKRQAQPASGKRAKRTRK